MIRPFRAIVLIGAPAVFLSGYATATTRVVPTQFPTIQAAIWASTGSDTVAVLPGTYVQNIVIDRGVVVRSTGGPAVTVIDGSNASNPDSASTVTMRAGVITGFDIRNGSGALDPVFSERSGGGVHATGSGSIRRNWIHNNTLVGFRGVGAGVYATGTVQITENRVYANAIEVGQFGSGAGISADGNSVLVERNEIYGNQVENGGAGAVRGWGVFRDNVIACNTLFVGSIPSSPASGLRSTGAIVEGNTVVGNWANDAPGLSIRVSDCVPVCPTEVFGNAIAFNIGPGLNCFVEPAGDVTFACNDFYGNTGVPVSGNCGDLLGSNGNIAVDPEFGTGTCPYQSGHWCLGPDSPLLPENSPPGCGLIGAVGECSQIGIADSPPPSSLRGGPAVPNPFTERTTIPFYLAKESAVEIAIVDVLGRQIRMLEPGHMGIGDHTAQWDGRTGEGVRAASGAYIAVIRTGAVEVTQTLLLLR